jgi:hypothetical protein
MTEAALFQGRFFFVRKGSRARLGMRDFFEGNHLGLILNQDETVGHLPGFVRRQSGAALRKPAEAPHGEERAKRASRTTRGVSRGPGASPAWIDGGAASSFETALRASSG